MTTPTRGRGGYHNARRGAKLKGLFADGIWQCDCNPRLPAEHFRVKKEGKNQGRWFYTCQKPELQRCGFFMFDDEAKVREESAIINNSRTEPRSTARVTENRHDAVHEQSRIPGVRPISPPRFSAHDPKAFFSRPEKHGNAESDQYDDDDEDWTLDSFDIKRLIDRTNQNKQTYGPQEPRTPVKRSHADIEATGLATPQTDSRLQSGYTNGEGASSKRRATDTEFLNLVSPATTPTPVRFRDALTGGGEDALFTEIQQALRAHGVNLNPDASNAVKDICGRSSLRMQGVIKGRDISRLALKAKDAKIVELSRRIDTLEAELETERALVRHLRWEREVNDK